MPSARAAAMAGRDDADLFVAEETAFARMRVEPRNSDARRRDAQRLAALVCEADGATSAAAKSACSMALRSESGS